MNRKYVSTKTCLQLYKMYLPGNPKTGKKKKTIIDIDREKDKDKHNDKDKATCN